MLLVPLNGSALDIAPSAVALGFSANRTGGHLARSMMLPELRSLVEHTPITADQGSYAQAVLSDNVLGKPTFASRDKSLRHLTQLYGLDPNLALFRILRILANDDGRSLPLLALVCAYCRDEQLRVSFDLISDLRPGQELTRLAMEEHLERAYPHRFSPAMKKSLAQNVNTTWTASGHLRGRSKKFRDVPESRLVASTYAMCAGYLLGLRGDVLLSSVFSRLVGCEPSLMLNHLADAAARGYLRFRHSGGVVEIDFTPLFTERERRLINEPH